MNPNSAYYLSFDTGFPNAYDRSLGRTGGALMVHGSCSSRGCFAMTDESIAEIYAIAREAFAGGQRGFQFQSYPFRMTAENLAKHRLDPNIAFWRNLKEGSDYFEVTKDEPRVSVASGRYQFNVTDETVVAAVTQKARQDEQAIAELVSSGVAPVKTVYHDGGSHESFVTAMTGVAGSDGSLVVDTRMRDKFGDVSRPEGLSSGPQEIALDDSGKPRKEAPSTALAFASAPKAVAPAAAAAPVAAPAAKQGCVVGCSRCRGRRKRRGKPLLQEDAQRHRQSLRHLDDPAADHRHRADRRACSTDPAAEAGSSFRAGQLRGRPVGQTIAQKKPAREAGFLLVEARISHGLRRFAASPLRTIPVGRRSR